MKTPRILKICHNCNREYKQGDKYYEGCLGGIVHGEEVDKEEDPDFDYYLVGSLCIFCEGDQ